MAGFCSTSRRMQSSFASHKILRHDCSTVSTRPMTARTLPPVPSCNASNLVTSTGRKSSWASPSQIPPCSPGNERPDYQQLLTGVELLIWLDSSNESDGGLEARVRQALTKPQAISRFGGLCLGESTHLVDEVTLIEKAVPLLTGRIG